MNDIKNNRDRSRALLNIAESYANAGDLEVATKIGESIADDYHRSQALSKISESKAKCRDSTKENIETMVLERSPHLDNITRATIMSW